MKQYFAVFIHNTSTGELVADIQCFDPEAGQITQNNTRCGIQATQDVIAADLNSQGEIVVTTRNGSLPISAPAQYKRLDPAMGDKLTAQFDNLQTGLRNQSPKTVAWLKKHGLYFVSTK